VTIEDKDQLYNDFIKGKVVEDDGNQQLVLSSSNQDSTAHELFRGEMPVSFGEEVRSQPQVALKQRRNKAILKNRRWAASMLDKQFGRRKLKTSFPNRHRPCSKTLQKKKVKSEEPT
jgi:hypothetical protein